MKKVMISSLCLLMSACSSFPLSSQNPKEITESIPCVHPIQGTGLDEDPNFQEVFVSRSFMYTLQTVANNRTGRVVVYKLMHLRNLRCTVYDNNSTTKLVPYYKKYNTEINKRLKDSETHVE